jgi:hypothetical protein
MSIDAGEGKLETEKRRHERRERKKQKCHLSTFKIASTK